MIRNPLIPDWFLHHWLQVMWNYRSFGLVYTSPAELPDSMQAAAASSKGINSIAWRVVYCRMHGEWGDPLVQVDDHEPNRTRHYTRTHLSMLAVLNLVHAHHLLIASIKQSLAFLGSLGPAGDWSMHSAVNAKSAPISFKASIIPVPLKPAHNQVWPLLGESQSPAAIAAGGALQSSQSMSAGSGTPRASAELLKEQSMTRESSQEQGDHSAMLQMPEAAAAAPQALPSAGQPVAEGLEDGLRETSHASAERLDKPAAGLHAQHTAKKPVTFKLVASSRRGDLAALTIADPSPGSKLVRFSTAGSDVLQPVSPKLNKHVTWTPIRSFRMGSESGSDSSRPSRATQEAQPVKDPYHTSSLSAASHSTLHSQSTMTATTTDGEDDVSQQLNTASSWIKGQAKELSLVALEVQERLGELFSEYRGDSKLRASFKIVQMVYKVCVCWLW